jgi:hypothetical protein
MAGWVHCTIPRDCTATVEGISAGDNTTMRGMNGSSRRLKWNLTGVLQISTVELSATRSPTKRCKLSSTRRSGPMVPPAGFSAPG